MYRVYLIKGIAEYFAAQIILFVYRFHEIHRIYRYNNYIVFKNSVLDLFEVSVTLIVKLSIGICKSHAHLTAHTRQANFNHIVMKGVCGIFIVQDNFPFKILHEFFKRVYLIRQRAARPIICGNLFDDQMLL